MFASTHYYGKWSRRPAGPFIRWGREQPVGLRSICLSFISGAALQSRREEISLIPCFMQVPYCREDCGSCSAMPCCVLEWDLPQNSAQAFASMLIASAQRGGPDGLYTLQGGLPSYANWLLPDPPCSSPTASKTPRSLGTLPPNAFLLQPHAVHADLFPTAGRPTCTTTRPEIYRCGQQQERACQ